MLRSAHNLPHPRLVDTRWGRSALALLVLVMSLYVLVPWLRVPLDASTPLIVAALVAGLTGVGWRVVADMLAGTRWYWRARDLWVMVVAASVLSITVVGITWQGWVAPITTTGAAALLTFAVRMILGGLIILTVRAGYADGDDETWRAEHGLG